MKRLLAAIVLLGLLIPAAVVAQDDLNLDGLADEVTALEQN